MALMLDIYEINSYWTVCRVRKITCLVYWLIF